MGWSILLLQEFSACVGTDRFVSSAGHQVYYTPPAEGSRACCIVIHSTVSHKVIPNSYEHRERGVALALHWQGWNLLLVSAHLSPDHSRERYEESIIQMQELCNRDRAKRHFQGSSMASSEILSTPVYTLVGVDAQTSVGKPTNRHQEHCIGPATMGERGWKGNEFVEFCLVNDLKIMNTFAADTQDVFTCTHDFRFPENQIDYVLADLPIRASRGAGVRSSTATRTDHRLPYFEIWGRWIQPKRPFVPMPKPAPIGWTCKDFSFCDQIREHFGWRKPDLYSFPGTAQCFSIYTDGSFASTRLRRSSFAGWGFAVFGWDKDITWEDALFRAQGSVITTQTDPMYIGAQRLSNNTAEISAIIEVCLWLLLIHQSFQDPAASDFVNYQNLCEHPIRIFTDSKYALGICKATIAPKENLLLCTMLGHVYGLVTKRFKVDIGWLKGHSEDPGNDIADKLAAAGRLGSATDKWIRPCINTDWDDQDFKKKVFNMGLISSHMPMPGRAAKRFNRIADAVIDLEIPESRTAFWSSGDFVATLDEFTKTVSDVAQTCGVPRGKPKKALPEDDPLLLEHQQLVNERRMCPDPLERARLSLKICSSRRKVRKKRLEMDAIDAARYGRVPRSSKPQYKVEVLVDPQQDDLFFEDHEAIAEHVGNFFTDLFNVPQDQSSLLPGWIYETFTTDHLDNLGSFDGTTLHSLILEMPKGKTGTDDFIVGEMLAELDTDILDHLADVFRMRLLNHHSELYGSAWDHCCANLIKKVNRPLNITQFRPIAILPVLSKLYSKLIYHLAHPFVRPLQAPQFAFRPGFQTHEVVYIIRRVIEVALEWAVPIWIGDGDIKKAYDYTRHDEVLGAIKDAGCPDILSAAWARELRSMAIKMKLGNIVTEPIHRTRALFQGDPSAPFLFNHCLDRPLAAFEALAQRHKWGIPMKRNGEPYYLAIVTFADNYWLFSTSPLEFQTMLAKWLQLLHRHGWHTPYAEIVYATTAQDADYTKPVVVNNHTIVRKKRKEGFKVLGTIITFDNQFDRELVQRASSAWCAFSKIATLLCCPDIPLCTRFDMLAKCVNPAMFYCAGSWNLRSNQLPTLRAVQHRMIRKMLHFTRPEQESIDDFMHRSNRTISNLITRHGIKRFDLISHKYVFRWAGKLVQIKWEDPLRITSIVFGHKDWAWIRQIELLNSGRQLHGRILRTWRWERPLYKCFGDDWQATAAQQDLWRSREQEFLSWRAINR